MPLEALDVRTLADQAFQRLEAAIVRGELAPGTKISEVALARAFGISRGPLREALQRLEGRNLAQRIPHSGMRIVQLAPGDIIELFDVREALEGMACRLAAQTAGDKDFDRLEKILEAHRTTEELQANRGYFQQAGIYDFHFAVVRLSRNAQLIKYCDQLYYPLRIYRYRSSRRTGRARDAYLEHAEIIEALRRRDAHTAEGRMRAHIRRARSQFEARVLEEADGSACTVGVGHGSPAGERSDEG